ncbi:permease [Oryzobacter telluris]|uniref:permease n=1 Tax=Oryzobacter telluris TaxID=3149179 RepID=UPI00370D3F96
MEPRTDEPTTDPPLRRRADRARGDHARPARAPAGDWAMVVLSVVMVGLILVRGRLAELVDAQAALAAWLTVFVSIGLQALPFLVLGVVLSAAIAVLVPADALTRWLPRHPAAAVPVAGISGLVLPGCECASVPIAGSLVSRGVKPAVALTFLLAAPAINPVVLVSTAVAFTGRYEMVGARFSASLLTAVVMGWLWLRLGRDHLIRVPERRTTGHGRLADFVGAARHDLLHAGGFLVLGSAVAATINVLVPRSVLDTLAGSLLVSVLVLAVFAFVVAVCSEADAFVAASLSQFPPTAQLAFMVVGPAIDVKLLAMQAGTFGRPFATVFAPLTFVVAIGSALLVGTVLL